MTKSEMVKEVKRANRLLTYSEITNVLETYFKLIEHAMLRGEKCQIGHICVLKPVIRSAHKARNPQTGANVDVPAKKSIKVIVTAAMRELMNK